MVVIRLARIGKKNHANFRIIVSDKQKDTKSPYLELLGTYDPHQTPTLINVQEDRVKYWLSVGAQPSATVHNLLVEKKIIDAPKVKVARIKKKPVTEDTTTPAAAAAQTEKSAEAPASAPATEPATVTDTKPT